MFFLLLSYEIQTEGFVQQISYASDTETGYLRLVSEDELDTPRFVCMNTLHGKICQFITNGQDLTSNNIGCLSICTA